jgi:hypothetical protein
MAERSREAVELDHAQRRLAYREDADAGGHQAGARFGGRDGAIERAHLVGRGRFRICD